MRQKERRIIYFYQFLVLLFILGLWEVTTHFRFVDPLIFSSPSTVTTLFISKLQDGTLLPHAWVTLLETIISFLLGTILGTVTAIFLWSSRTAAQIAEPYLVVLNAMPKVAIGPIILVLFGPNTLAIIMMGILISVVVSTIVIFSAFQRVDEHYIKVMQLFHASKAQIFRHVIFPASIPTIISTLKVNVGLAWVGVIVGEFLVSSKGLGYLIISGFQIFNFNVVFLALSIILVLATFMYKAVELLEKWLLKKFNFQ
ncbi:MAG: ABC transporter permease [Solibacillus sp.]